MHFVRTLSMLLAAVALSAALSLGCGGPKLTEEEKNAPPPPGGTNPPKPGTTGAAPGATAPAAPKAGR